MRKDYPLSSQLLNNKLFTAYENLVYLLGQSIEGQPYYSGLYEKLEASGINAAISPTGIFTGTLDSQASMIDILKFDYFHRLNFRQIKV
jgi:hypothetical protein